MSRVAFQTRLEQLAGRRCQLIYVIPIRKQTPSVNMNAANAARGVRRCASVASRRREPVADEDAGLVMATGRGCARSPCSRK
jgi:hypothetical protein